ncbi:NACHT domain-containing protein [Empedobacter sp. ULE_I145]
MWDSFNTYGGSFQNSFEMLCNQLFERYLSKEYQNSIDEFKVINGAGGDGGIEAYGKLSNSNIIAIQSKWFKQALDTNELNQIKKSITTALTIRPNIIEYIICIPHNVSSIKIGKGKKPTQNSEDIRIENFEKEIKNSYPVLKITWWFEHSILEKLQKAENEGVHKYWFENEIIHSKFLKDKFDLQKTNYWLKERYVGDLHTKGDIQNLIDKQLYSPSFRNKILVKILDFKNKANNTKNLSEKFINQSSKSDELTTKLKQINCFIEDLIEKSLEFETRLTNGIAPNLTIDVDQEIPIIYTIEDTIKILTSIKPTDLQKPIYNKLEVALREISTDVINSYFVIENELITISTSLILGKPGTGKTLGLAYAVEECLNKYAPAILIQAKGSNSKDWTQLLSQELELSNWNKNEIFSALETLAIGKDCELATNNTINFENTSVLICIDGLEEDILNDANWYNRINEALEITSKYKRIRFVFSAREYFYNNERLPDYQKNYKELRLKREGDVKVEDVAKKYFEKYNITIENYQSIKGLDSLFALKLFCETYQGSTIKRTEIVETTTSKLINLKIYRINKEYLESLDSRKSKSRNAVLEFLSIISDLFYYNSEVSHTEILDIGIENKLKYLDSNEIELLIEFLSNNGILIKYERNVDSDFILETKESFYTFSYQSILEIIVSSKISRDIINGKIDCLPDSLFNQISLSTELDDEAHNSYSGFIPNQRIIQDIINELFIKKRKLIGIDDFLTNGFTKDEIFELQLNALYAVPNEISYIYKDWITEIFTKDYIKRFQILQDLIIPLSYDKNSSFNAMYLHNILKNITNHFERDKFWSGLDDYESNIMSKKLNIREYDLSQWSLTSILEDNYDLDETDMFDGLPLIYTWGFTTLDQKLRENLRIKLTKWALILPLEFKKLLDLMLPIDEQQILEDLASITLGISTKCKNENAILELALWCLNNIFSNTDKYRNVIVRYGFRAIVERAFQYNLISKTEVEKSHPAYKDNLILLEVDEKYIINPVKDPYPIGHDLSWYVIKKAYDDFLSVETGFNSLSFDKENPFITDFYQKYSLLINNSTSARIWGMATALSYIKSLGFNRETGYVNTDATHGSKSEKFTFEEKYVWLAVHYLKGYLSDYLPYEYDDENKEFNWIDDYSKIVNISNPVEDLQINLENQVDEYFNPPLWIIKDELAPEINNLENTGIEIDKIINNNPKIDFNNWLKYSNLDFNSDIEKEYLSIYQSTGLTNSSETIKSYIDCNSYLINEKDFDLLLKQFSQNSKSIHLNDFGSPDTDTYTSPSNLFWMDWVGENYNETEFDEDIYIYNCLTKVMKDTVDGEKEVIIPSKKVRKLLSLSELDNNNYLTINSDVIGFSHEIKTERYSYGDHQSMILIDKNILLHELNKNSMKLFWVATHFIKKNPSNKEIEEIEYNQKIRNYVIWLDEMNELQSIKYFEG